ncbi:MAG TPA: response regulator [Pseudonocardiaceae bacterium]|nr:response regulator [Pseudonocardiaceae bacterium]
MERRYLDNSHTARLFDESMKSVIIERSGRNPRRIKRLINSFVLEYHLNRAWDEIGVQNLVKVIMLQHFYPDFYRILTSPRDADPIAEFGQYVQFRSMVKRGGEWRSAEWQDVFLTRGLRPPTEDGPPLGPYLAELEQELPTDFPALAADRDFVALIESFDEPGIDTEQFRRMLRRPLTPDLASSYAQATGSADDLIGRINAKLAGDERVRLTDSLRAALAPGAGATQDVLQGLRILWIDDFPRSNGNLTDALVRRGVTVVSVEDRASAIAAIKEHRPDVVLSDFTRDGDANAGIDDLEYLRVHRVYDGPVIFCSGQGTPNRRRRVEELGARGPTNDENDMMRWLLEIAADRAQQETT